MSFSLKLLGGVTLESESGPVTGPAAQRHRLALLALLATSARGVSRDKLMAWLWPARDAERARQLLNQAVHVLRRALGADAILSTGEELRFNPEAVSCDVVAFEEALSQGAREQAVALYAGPFLDGFFLDDAAEFERWADRERDRLAASCAKALEGLAAGVEAEGDWVAAARWWKARAAIDPLDSRVAVRLTDALERAGNRAGALQHALAHQQLLRDDLEVEPGPEMLALVERLRREPMTAPQRLEDIGNRWEPVPTEGAAAAAVPSASVPQHRAYRAIRYGAAVVLVGAALGIAFQLASRRGATGLAPKPTVMDEMARAVVREMDRRESGATSGELPQRRTRSIPAYELYLRGSDPALLRSDSTAQLGLEYFRQAVTLDPTYAAAWAGLARMQLRVAEDADLHAAAQARAEAEAAARQAVALDDALAEGHAILALARSIAYDFDTAEPHFTRAIALEPTNARYREWAVDFYLAADRPVEALAEAERALALSPLSPTATAELARALLVNDRCDEALTRLERIAALDPPLLRAAPIAAQCFARKRMWNKAIERLRPQAERGEHLSLALLGYLLGRAGQRHEAQSIQARLEDRWRNGAFGAYYLAFVPTGLGDRDEAFAWLDRSLAERSAGYYPGLRAGLAEPVLNDLRADPRWEALHRRLGLRDQ
jgi:DNA-binding SARP family transcriptional activator